MCFSHGVSDHAYVLGVSTRRVEGLVQTLGVAGISKSQGSTMAQELDAMVDEFRNRPLDRQAVRYVWLDALVISDAHPGLRDAFAATLPGAS